MAIACLLSSLAYSQVNTSTVAGIITDPSGGAISNTTVTLTDEATGQQRTVNTSDIGEYAIPQLPPGHCDLKVEAKGFQTAVSKNIVLDIAQRASVNLALQVGNTTSTVEVSASADVLDTDTASLGQTISQNPSRTCH